MYVYGILQEQLSALVAGTLLHFVYEWFGGNVWAVIGAVNESTWEHLKLLFFPVGILVAH